MEYNITVQHKSKKLVFDDLNQDTTINALALKIQEQTTIPPSLQKLIYKGKKLNLLQTEQTLGDVLGKTKKVKMTLIGSTTNDIISSTTLGRKTKTQKGGEESKEKESDNNTWEHANVVRKIQPHFEEAKKQSNFVTGDKGKNEPLPKSIDHIFNDSAESVRVVFQVDKREVWIASKEQTRKVSFDEVRNVKVEAIPEQDEYTAIGFQIGTDPNKDVEWYFFIPKQFEKSIRYTLLGNLSFPFLHSSS